MLRGERNKLDAGDLMIVLVSGGGVI
jgi:hypothetical protein